MIFGGFRPLMGINKFNYANEKVLLNRDEVVLFPSLMGINKFNPVFETAYIYWFQNLKNGGDYILT